MIEYIVYDRQGQVTQRGTCQPDMLQLQGDPTHTAIEFPGATTISGMCWYDQNTRLAHVIPDAPTQYHTFNWGTRAWELPASASAQAKAGRKGHIEQQRELAIENGLVSYNGNQYQVDRMSIANITSTVTAVQSGVPLPAGFAWRSAANVNVPFAIQDLVTLGALALQFVNAAYAKSWALKAQIDAATTLDQIQLVEW